MRFSSSSLQLLAASTDSTMAYSRAASRGRNSWRRGFSDRPNGGRDEFVSGDSHLRSVGDANYTYRQVEGQNFSNSGGFQWHPPFRQPPQQPPFRHSHQPPPLQQQQQFWQAQPPFHPPPHFEQQPSFQQPQNSRPPSHQRPSQYSRQQQPFRQPPPYSQPRRRPPNYKPPDFRSWEYALSQPPSHCERFIVLSYNILADYLAINHRLELYNHIPHRILDWEWRKKKILVELGLWSPDILCLQEVDRFQDLEEELKRTGYSGVWKMRTGIPTDGCAILWRTTRFKLLHEENIEYNKLGLRDNVAQICVLESRNQNCAGIRSDALPQSSNGANQVVICNTHVLYNPKRGEIKLGQVRVLLERAHAVSKLWNDAPVVLCGDFNCTPKSPIYNFISERKLDLTGLARDQTSGQFSAQIPPPRPYNRNSGPASFRAQTPDISNQASILVEEKEAGAMQSDSTLGIHNLNEPNNMDKAPVTNNIHQSDIGSSDVHYNEEAGAISFESSKELQDESIDSVRTSSSSFVPIALNRDQDLISRSTPCENSAISAELSKELQDEPIDGVQTSSSSFFPVYFDGDQELISPLTPCESNDTMLVEKGHGDHLSDSTDQSLPETFTENSQSNSYISGVIVSTKHAMDMGTPDMKVNVTCIESNVYHSTLGHASIQEFKSELVSETIFSDENEVSLSESLGDLSLELIVDEEKVNPPSCNTSVDIDEDDEKLGEVTEQKGSSGQASISTLLSESDRTEETFQSESVETEQSPENHAISPQSDEIQGGSSLSVDPDLTARKENYYDRSSWTPMEIETATGSAECTLLEHPLKLRSTYADVEDYSGTRDSNREPLVTSYNRRFMGTVDYIWCSEGLQTVKVLDTIPKHALQWTPGFPTPKWGSDHIALATQLAFKEDKNLT